MKRLEMGPQELKLAMTHLRQVDFFKDLPSDELENIARFIKLRQYEPGAFIFEEGDAGDALYIVFEGYLSVKRKKLFFLPGQKTGELHPGNCFGESCLLDRRPRACSVQALTPSKIFILAGNDFDDLVEQSLSFAKQIRKVSERRHLAKRAA